mmetsp:Transcript_36268/g.48597  ORF Transcript_36268/g.48597 Transcript_36268/m.48597 type:complete len:397 (-) Transcript_36268:554-1744(-)
MESTLASKESDAAAPPKSDGKKNGKEEEETPTNEEENAASVDENEEKEDKEELFHKHQLRGYIVLIFASTVNMVASIESNQTAILDRNGSKSAFVIPASEAGRNFAIANAGITGGFAFIAFIAHIDRISCLKGIWKKLFKPNALFEMFYLFFLVLWTAASTWVNTSIQGIAGPGKGQFDIYFATWISFITVIWTLERYYVNAGNSSFYAFFSSWPHRGFGWILLFAISLADFFFVLDEFLNWESGLKRVPQIRRTFAGVEDWEWGLFLAGTIQSFMASFIFSAVELFRISKIGITSEKTTWETWTEGAILIYLTVWWLLIVILFTIPNGIGSLYGNVYFFTWAGAVSVIKTLLWWVRDWRREIHVAMEKQHEEYQKAKKAALGQGLDSIEDGQISE